jgi:predicted ATPase/class 3 adenylate cyclase
LRVAHKDLPTGTITFLFTDIEGSTRLLHEVGGARFAEALAEHRRALRQAFVAHGGVEVDTQGDAFFVAFATAEGAVAAARRGQEALGGGPIRVRIGIHTGAGHVSSAGYVGEDVHKAARIAAAGHGGQILLSQETRDLVDGEFADLGEHRLKDFGQPVWIFQLGSEEFPPLKTISNTNLPRPASSFVGREREVAELTALLADDARFVTLMGTGGSGKTRLAIEVAAELIPRFKAGVFWVELAALRDPTLVLEAIARILGAKDRLTEHIADRELLLLLDNLEQVVASAPELATLVESCPNLRLLVTSRELLRVRGECGYPVLPLAEQDAVELFCARAGIESDESVGALCRALDHLPLALELAAARTSILSPAQIVDRLAGRLDLFKAGRGADPRQQTLRATIEWSYELLAKDERRLFARLAVFAGGCTLEAAETVAEAKLNALQSLVEKSLLRRVEGRLWMLETIREYALERLEESGEGAALLRRHARWFLELARQQDAELRAGKPEEGPVAVLEQEIDNLRAGVEFGLGAGDAELVREITATLPMYWIARGRYGEGRAWLERALALDDVEDDTRRRLLSGLGSIAYIQGDYVAAVTASDEAAELAVRVADATEDLELLTDQAVAALRRGDVTTAETLFRDRLALALALDNGVAASSSRLNLVYIANKTDRFDSAETLLAENLPFVRSKGQVRCEACTLAGIAETGIYRGRADEVAEEALLAARRALQIDEQPIALYALELLAAATAASGQEQVAATILTATEAAREAMGAVPDPDEQAIRERAIELVGDAAIACVRSEGRTLDLASALEFAKASCESGHEVSHRA